ncbi:MULTISPECIES: hypothetical protein [Chryseobacterium]|uniref:Lipoprotein n=1 Tax=Chryseobacterium caseinilyticum TaxID=2771428 RepID=A0ABR8ZBB8_9FLAO|nr:MULTISPECIES: hypothetical protein [Chryseobacterium]KQS93041.1 hypothetical protein ASG21_11600 [Chryseobacterium sp. Leaf394]MBD8082138.1 hypothetical protein [Chryseobacterium caseinilyticum]
MKNTIVSALLVLFCAVSCADKKENREEFKEEHNKDSMRNKMGDSAVANSETVNAADSSTSKTDSTEKPTNYKTMPPNQQGGGNR